MTTETAFLFIMSLILLWIKPGPGQALKITRALNDGFWAGFYVALGVITACVTFFLIAVLGTNTINALFTDAGLFFKIAGGLYLLYIGIKGLYSVEKGKWKKRTDTSQKKSFFKSYPLGLFVTLANPLPIFYFLSIMPTLVPVGVLSPSDILTGIAIIVTVGVIVDSTLLLLVAQMKEALSQTIIIRRINVTTSIGFILIGVFLLSSIFI